MMMMVLVVMHWALTRTRLVQDKQQQAGPRAKVPTATWLRLLGGSVLVQGRRVFHQEGPRCQRYHTLVLHCVQRLCPGGSQTYLAPANG